MLLGIQDLQWVKNRLRGISMRLTENYKFGKTHFSLESVYFNARRTYNYHHLNPVIIFVSISLGRSKDYSRDHSPNARYIKFLTVSIMNSEEGWSILTKQPLRQWSPKDFLNADFITPRLSLLCFVPWWIADYGVWTMHIVNAKRATHILVDFFCRHCTVIGTLRNYDGNGKQVMYISLLLSLHNVKWPKCNWV